MFFSLDGKVAVVTGAASGIGKCTAERFLKAGAKVVSADIRFDHETVQDENQALVRVDVSREEQIKALMETAVSLFGRLDIVVNNAGIGMGEDISSLTEETFDRLIAVNTKSVLFGIKHAAGKMNQGGSIINTASLAGITGFPSYAAYGASKAAVISLTKNAAIELAPRRIRVNAVCPSTVDTPINDGEMAQVELKLATYLHPLGRIGKPEEVAALYHYLASDESAFITGLAIPFDAGFTAGVGLGIIEPLIGMITGGG
jgi:3alpha(or 20beta)-hydroxysteroid dehydrogenase